MEVTPPKESRNWAMASHLAGVFASYLVPFGGLIAPLVIWLVKKDDDDFVGHHALETLNFQLTMALVSVVCIALALTVVLAIVAIPLLVAAVVVSLVYGILGAIAASEGRWFEYPNWVLRLVKPS